MFLFLGLLFALILFIVVVNTNKTGKKILLGWLITSWIFVIVFGLIPIGPDGLNLGGLLALKIGMPTAGTFDEILTWSVLHQAIFAIGGMMFLTVPFSLVFGLIYGLSGGMDGIKDLFTPASVVADKKTRERSEH